MMTFENLSKEEAIQTVSQLKNQINLLKQANLIEDVCVTEHAISFQIWKLPVMLEITAGYEFKFIKNVTQNWGMIPSFEVSVKTSGEAHWSDDQMKAWKAFKVWWASTHPTRDELNKLLS